VLDVAHALVVADDQRQQRHHHHAAVGHVAVKQVHRVGDAHVLGGFVDVVHQRVQTFGEIVGGAHFDVGTGRRLCCEVGRCLQVAVAGLGLHFVSHQNVFAA
jgi:sugar phosphate isomerase/epimerase